MVSSGLAVAWSGFFLALSYRGVQDFVNGSTPLKLIANSIVVVGVIAALHIYIGMWWYCVKQDRLSVSKKLLWYLAFVIALWYGSIAYYFLRYRDYRAGAM